MEPFGKILIVTGASLLILGTLIWLLARAGFKGLPGDISYQGPHGTFYFPVVTCIVLSVLATLVMWLIQWLNRR